VLDKLNQQYDSLRNRLLGHKSAVTDHAVEATAKAFGLELQPRMIPGTLSKHQVTALEASFSALLELVVTGSTGLAPKFVELYRSVQSRLQAAGWHSSPDGDHELLAGARATAAISGLRARHVFVHPDKISEVLTRHNSEVAHLVERSKPADSITVQEAFYHHSNIPKSALHLFWRDEGNRKYTNFEFHLFLDDEFASLARELIMSEVIWRSLSSNYQSLAKNQALSVSGDMFAGGRDGIGTNFSGWILGSDVKHKCSELRLPVFPVQISVQLSETMM
jgi:hypothetical protein